MAPWARVRREPSASGNRPPRNGSHSLRQNKTSELDWGRFSFDRTELAVVETFVILI